MELVKGHAYLFQWTEDPKYHYINKIIAVDEKSVSYLAIHANDPNYALGDTTDYVLTDLLEYILENCKGFVHLGPTETAKENYPELFI